MELDRDTYDAATVKSQGLVLVDFWGPLCKPCLALMPAVEEIEKDYAGRLTVAKVNSTKNRMLCARLRVMSLPTFVLYKDGVEKARLTGDEIRPADLRSEIDKSAS